MSDRRTRIKTKIFREVESRWPTLEYIGRFLGYRYCFVETVSSVPLPIYKQLVVRHNRRKKELEAWWTFTLLRTYRRETPPPGVSHSSSVLSTETSSWNERAFFDQVADEESRIAEQLHQKLLNDQKVQDYVWEAFEAGKTTGNIPLAYHPVIAEIVGQENYRCEKPQNLKISSFLAEMVPEEAAPEEGQFTLETSKARAKLSDFQLTDPQNFILHLIAGGIAGGAPEILVYVDSDDIVVEFEGTPLTREDLEHLFSKLLSGQSSARQRELAVALNAASSLRPKTLYLETWNGTEGWRVDIEGDKEIVTNLSESPFADSVRGHRAHFRDQPSLKVVKRFLNSLHQEHPEQDIVRQRACHAPVPVKLDRKHECRWFPLASSQLLMAWEHPSAPLPIVDATVREPCSDEVSLLIFLGPKPEQTVVVHGICYPPPEPLELWNLFVLIYPCRVNRDLSMAGLSIDKEWSTIKNVTLEARDRFLEFTLDHFHNLPDDSKEKLSLSLSLQECLRAGCERLEKQPTFKQVAGEYVDLEQARNAYNLLYTEWDWEFGLRSEEPVYILGSGGQELMNREMTLANPALAESQTYFRALREWRKLKPFDSFSELEDDGFHWHGPKGSMMVSLQRRAVDPSLVSWYSTMRPLPPNTETVDNLPSGLNISLNCDNLEMEMDWTEVTRDKTYFEQLKAVRKQLPDFYKEYLKTEDYSSEHVLYYLLHLERRGENWKQYGSLLKFSVPGGQKVTLDTVIEQLSEDKFERFLRAPKRAVKEGILAALVSRRELELVRDLVL